MSDAKDTQRIRVKGQGFSTSVTTRVTVGVCDVWLQSVETKYTVSYGVIVKTLIKGFGHSNIQIINLFVGL